jgi:hypothetical protein
LATVINESAIAKLGGESAATNSPLGFEYQHISTSGGKQPCRV